MKSLEKDKKYREATFDPEYDDFVSDNCLELEAYVSHIDRKYSRYSFNSINEFLLIFFKVIQRE